MDNCQVRDNLSKIAQLAQHMVTKMLRHPKVLPTPGQWSRLYELYDLAGEADRSARRERRRIRGGRDVCRFCGCSEDDACMLVDGPCSWMDRKRTVCSNPECLKKWNTEQAEAKP